MPTCRNEEVRSRQFKRLTLSCMMTDDNPAPRQTFTGSPAVAKRSLQPQVLGIADDRAGCRLILSMPERARSQRAR